MFRSNDKVTEMEGFCNNCSKPLLIIKDHNGRYQSNHSDCNLKRTSITSDKDIIDSTGTVETPGLRDSPVQLQLLSSVSSPLPQEEMYSSPRIGAERIEGQSHGPLATRRKSYYQNLKVTVDDFGEYEDVLRYLPDFYLLLCNIVKGGKSSWYTKMLSNAALSYLVLESDLISDKKGASGYLDDLFLCAYVLKEIRDKVSKNVILENLGKLDYGEEIFQLIYDVVNITSQYLEGDTEEILRFVGLDSFALFDFLYENEMSKKIENRKEKKKMFYAMIAVKAKQILESNNNAETVALKSLIRDHYEFAEINTYMRFLDDGQ